MRAVAVLMVAVLIMLASGCYGEGYAPEYDRIEMEPADDDDSADWS